MRALDIAKSAVQCYTDDWQRTHPDFAVYIPQVPFGADGYNDHFLVSVTPAGSLLAMWTQGSREAARDIRVVCSRSEDGGHSWQPLRVIADHDGIPGLVSCFGFPVISDSGRIYCFYNKNLGVVDGGHYFTGVLRCLYSDDDGHSWTPAGLDIPFRRRRYDHPDPRVPSKCIVWQKPVRDSKGRWLAGFSRWSSTLVFPKPRDGYHWDSSAELLRFENISRGPHPRDLEITWLPAGAEPLRVECPIEPERSRGYSLCEEPSLALLPDGRLFLTVRTVTGRIWYSVSDDDGATWRATSILRYSDTGPEVLHPKSPCPLYRLEDGRFLLLFHNHDGFSYGANGPWDMNARRPVFVSIGEFQPEAQQPIWFGRPRLLFDTEGVGVGPESLIWLAMYSSITEFQGQRILWYPDRKHFLLGRIISDDWLRKES